MTTSNRLLVQPLALSIGVSVINLIDDTYYYECWLPSYDQQGNRFDVFDGNVVKAAGIEDTTPDHEGHAGGQQHLRL